MCDKFYTGKRLNNRFFKGDDVKNLLYQCDSCEDTETWDKILKDGFHCECGGHLKLIKTDNFDRVDNFTYCLMCKNKGTDECVDCTRCQQNG